MFYNNDFCSTKHSFNQGKESGLTYGLNTVRLLGGSGVRGLSPLNGRDKSFTQRLPDFTSRSDQRELLEMFAL